MNPRRYGYGFLAACLVAGAAVGAKVTFPFAEAEQRPSAALAPSNSVIHYVVVSGDSWVGIANRYGLSGNELARQNRTTISSTLQPGNILHIVPGTPPTTTTTLPPATTLPPTTTVTSTTLPPSTTTTSTTVAPTTTTTAPTTTTTVVPTTTVPGSGGFSEMFTGNTGLNRFRTGVFYRERDSSAFLKPLWVQNTPWSADHDPSQTDCGDPVVVQHQVQARDNTPVEDWWVTPVFYDDDMFYVCRDHLMTTMGDVSGYTIVWFTPNQIFNGQTKVSWDATVTNLGARKWWEVAIIPAGGPEATAIEWLAGTANTPTYPNGAVVFGNGPLGAQIHAHHAGVDTQLSGNICSQDPAGCLSKADRRQFSMTDNRNGTITFRFNDQSWTLNGSFPPGNFEVIFKDHSYSPDKDGPIQGYTWHWDNIIVN